MMKTIRKILLLKASILVLFLTLSFENDRHLTEVNTDMGGFANHQIVKFKSNLWLVGGDNRETAPWQSGNHIWSSINGRTWKKIGNGPFTERKNHSLLVYRDKMWLIGGIDNAGNILSDIWVSTNGRDWTQVRTLNPLQEIGQNSSVVFNDRIFVFKGNGVEHEEVWSTTTGTSWKLETKNAFPVRSHYKTVVHNNQIFVIGGWIRGGNHTNEVWASKDGKNWSKKSAFSIFKPRINHTATSIDGKVWVIGGQTSGKGGQRIFYNDIWYSTDMQKWTKYNGKSPIKNGLHSHASLVFQNQFWTFGGYIPDGSNADVASPLIWHLN